MSFGSSAIFDTRTPKEICVLKGLARRSQNAPVHTTAAQADLDAEIELAEPGGAGGGLRSTLQDGVSGGESAWVNRPAPFTCQWKKANGDALSY